jgi:hypothetical protein
VVAFLAASFLLAALVLVDSLVLGDDYAASHQANVAAATIGAAVGGLYGVCRGVRWRNCAGLDEG